MLPLLLLKVTFRKSTEVENRAAEPFLKMLHKDRKSISQVFLEGDSLPSSTGKNLLVKIENGSTNGNLEVVRKGKTLSRHLTDLP